MDKINAVTCSICKKEDAYLLYKKTGFNVAGCRACGMVFSTPQPSSQELRKMYSRDYYQPWNIEKEEVVRKIKMATFERRILEIQKYVSGGKILDVGCATGFFLEKAQSKGFEPYGIEISAFSYQQGRKKFGDHIFNGTIEDVPFGNILFDVITMFDLLEHVKDPVATLRCCKKILKPHGIIVAVLPDVSSLTARLMGKTWTHYKKEHLFYFSKRTITDLLKQESFEVLKIIAARKVMNLEYLYNQFIQYPHAVATPIATALYKLLPRYLRTVPCPVTMGEILVTARRSDAPPA